MKHETSLITVKKINKGGFTFPISFPFSSPCTEIYCIDVSNIKPHKNHKKRHLDYLNTLNNKRIIETLEELEKMLKIN